MLCAKSLLAQVHRLIHLSIDGFESSARSAHLCGSGAAPQVGESTFSALLAFVTSILHVAGIPCPLWSPLSSFPSGKPGA